MEVPRRSPGIPSLFSLLVLISFFFNIFLHGVCGISVGEELSLVYGPKKLSHHGIMTLSSLRETQIPVPHSSLEGSSLTGSHTICADYDKGSAAQRSLLSNLGKDYFHPLYISKRDNAICFIAILNTTTLAVVNQLPSLRSIIRTPPQLKLHESVLALISFTSPEPLSSSSPRHSHEIKYLKALHRSNEQETSVTTTTASVLSQTKLVISFGVGAIGKHDVAKETPGHPHSVHEIQQKLSQRSPSQDLLSFIDHAALHLVDENHESLADWREAYQHFHSTGSMTATGSSCPDQQLSLNLMTPSQLIIGNLHEYISSSRQSHSCFLSLLSHLLVTYSDTIADLRLRFPKYPNNHLNKGIVQTKVYSENYPYRDVGLDGSGQIVGVGDTGIDELSCFFRNPDGSTVTRSSIFNPTFNLTKRKVIQYINYADGQDREGGHGTHVSGTVAGSSEGFVSAGIKYGGHASGAKIAFFDMEVSSSPNSGLQIPSPTADYVFQAAYDAGARIHSNSWGTFLNAIDDDDLSIDDFQYSKTDFLAVFAAGNDGTDGFYSIGQPGTTKNSLTVGASRSDSSDEISKVAYFSSLGPTFDERIKPEVVGPGYFTTSTYASPTALSCSIVDMAGTSMATPLVSGVGAQIRQYFQTFNTSVITSGCRLFTGTGSLSPVTCDFLSNPKGSTVKAMLIHSGELMSEYDSEGLATQATVALIGAPDMYQGFGRVTLPNVLPYPGIETVLTLHVVETEIFAYQQISHLVQVNDISRPMKATIVWMDPNNAIMTNKMLLNNLDLKVITPTGLILYGNNISGDEVNNVEQVTIMNPVLGEYSVIVSSSFLVTTSQNFSLIVTGGNLSFDTHDASVPNTEDYNPYNCGANETYVQFTALDHGGDGWGAGNSFELHDISEGAGGALVTSGTLTNEAGQQFRKIIPLCLSSGRNYSVSLLTTGLGSEEMGLEVSPCNTFLSKYLTSATFSLPSSSSSSSLTCGQCPNQFQFQIRLSGSFYGVPYGWRQGSHYSLWSPDTTTNHKGTLVTGIYGLHSYCLPSGTWYLEFSDVPTDDDGFIADDFLAGYFGVQEYRMVVSDGVTEGTMSAGQRTTLSVTGTSASMSIGNAGPTSSPTVSPSPSPTSSPTTSPTSPSVSPSSSPSVSPSSPPSVSPSSSPSSSPSVSPSSSPSVSPSAPEGICASVEVVVAR